jgi:UrcA family protein
MKLKTPHIAIAAVGCLVVSGIAMAQVPEIVVEAPYRPATPPKTAPGSKERLPEISIDSHVQYSDLDLSTHAGAVELEKRIKDAATDACRDLKKLYPDSTEGVGKESCVEVAVQKATVQANKAIAAAEKKK